MPLQLRRPRRVAEHDHLAAARRRLLQVRRRLLEQRPGRSDRDHRHRRIDQRDRPVLHLAGGIALGVDVADLLQLQRALQRDREAVAAPEVTARRAPARRAARSPGSPRRSPAPRPRGSAPPAAPPVIAASCAAAIAPRRPRPPPAPGRPAPTSCAVNALVLATPISGPATVSSTASLSRAMRAFRHVQDRQHVLPLLAHVAQRRQRIGRLARLRHQQAQPARAAAAACDSGTRWRRRRRSECAPSPRTTSARPARHRTRCRRRSW